MLRQRLYSYSGGPDACSDAGSSGTERSVSGWVRKRLYYCNSPGAGAGSSPTAKLEPFSPPEPRRPAVGDRVRLRRPKSGVLEEGAVGTVVEDDGSDCVPLKVVVGNGRWDYYNPEDLFACPASEDSVAAKPVAGMIRRPQPGEAVILTARYRDFANAAVGPLKPNSIGMVASKDDSSELPYLVNVGDRQWYYEEGALQPWAPILEGIVPCDVSAEGSPKTSEPEVTQGLQTGDAVMLAAKYADFSNAAVGPLKPGDVGTIIGRDDSDDIPYLVSFGCRQWYYEEDALQLCDDGSAEETAAISKERLLKPIDVSPPVDVADSIMGA